MEELLAYQTFSLKSEATEVAERLRKAGIIAEIVEKAVGLGGVFVGSNYADGYILRISAADFSKANSILYDSNSIAPESISPDHPLNAMSNDELKDIVAKPDEWGADNYNIAMALLKSRDMTISEKELAEMREERIAVLSERKHMNPALLFVGYFTALSPVIANLFGTQDSNWANRIHDNNGLYNIPAVYFVWYFPGVAGLLLGFLIIGSKTTLPDGRRILTYDKATIKHGINISVLNILSWLVNILVVLFKVL